MSENDFLIFKKYIKELITIYGTIDNRGNCLKVSLEACVILSEYGLYPELVHANIEMDNKIQGHAWLEYGNTIIDLTLHKTNWINEAEEYYEIAKIYKIKKYSMIEMQSLILKNKGDYFWEDWFIFQD